MTNLKVLIAILVFCICNYTQVFGSASVHTFLHDRISLATPSSGSISHNKIVYGLCKNSGDNTTVQCNIYANSTHFGESFVESCPIELNSRTNKSSLILTGKTVYLMSDDKVMLMWQEVMWKKRRLYSKYPVTMHIHLIDLKNCDVLKNISLDGHLRPPGAVLTPEYDYNVMFLDDGSFQVGYFKLNPNSTSMVDRYLPYYIMYDKNGNVIVPAQSPDIPDILKSNESPYIISDLLNLDINHWLPISPVKGHFFITIYSETEFNKDEDDDYYEGIEAKLSVFTSDNKVKITKNLGSLKNMEDVNYGHGNFAYCVSYNKKSSLRCSMLDSELNAVYNVSLHPGFEFFQVKIFVPAPNEMLILVIEKSYNDQWNLRAYKINSAGRVSKPVVIDGYDDYLNYNTIDNMGLHLKYLTNFDDRVCFHFSLLKYVGPGIIANSCVNKHVLDIY